MRPTTTAGALNIGSRRRAIPRCSLGFMLVFALSAPAAPSRDRRGLKANLVRRPGFGELGRAAGVAGRAESA